MVAGDRLEVGGETVDLRGRPVVAARQKEAQDRLHRLDRDQIGETEDGGGIAAALDQRRGGLAQVEAALLERARPQRPQRAGVEQAAIAGETAQPALGVGLERGRERLQAQGVGLGVAGLDDGDLRPAGQGGDGPVPQAGRGLVRHPLVADEAVAHDRRAEVVEHGLVDLARLDALGRAVVHQARECGAEVLVRQEGIERRPGWRQRVQGSAGQHLAAGHRQGLEHQALDVGPTRRCDAGGRGQGTAQGTAEHAGIGRYLTWRLTQHTAQAAHRRAQIGHLARRQVRRRQGREHTGEAGCPRIAEGAGAEVRRHRDGHEMTPVDS